MSAPTATASVDVAAADDEVYRWLTDLAVFGTLTEETHAMHWSGGADSASVGAVFRGANRNGWRRWSTTCEVTDADPGRCFGFRVTSIARTPVSRWVFDLEPTGAGSCRVTESTWDDRPAWFRLPAGLATGEPDRTAANQRHIEATLARIHDRARDR